MEATPYRPLKEEILKRVQNDGYAWSGNTDPQLRVMLNLFQHPDSFKREILKQVQNDGFAWSGNPNPQPRVMLNLFQHPDRSMEESLKRVQNDVEVLTDIPWIKTTPVPMLSRGRF